MFHFKRVVFAFLGIVVGVASSVWAGDAVKVPLVTSAIPGDVTYTPASVAVTRENPWMFLLNEANPTTTLTIGGLECFVRDELAIKVPEDGRLFPGKLFVKTPLQEFIHDLMPFILHTDIKPMELTLEDGRKYFLQVGASHPSSSVLNRRRLSRKERSGLVASRSA